MSQQVIVLGMHRSYTTLLAQWLHTNGVFMFDPGEPTPRYFEHPEIFKLHETFLESQHMNWLNARKPFTVQIEQYQEAAFDIWKYHKARFPIWGWKDPRTCILYESLWAPFSQNAKFLVVYRDPAEVLESLLTRKIRKRRKYQNVPEWIYSWYLRRRQIDYDNAHLVCWNYYNKCIIKILETKAPEEYILVNAGDLLQHETQIHQTVTDIWKIPLHGYPLSSLIQPSTIRKGPDLGNLDATTFAETQEILASLQSLHSFR